ncbi:unnamed protein product [Closterium sp. NIES-64]|nr:unnamed protein product [Closterium sp. NIES-64]
MGGSRGVTGHTRERTAKGAELGAMEHPRESSSQGGSRGGAAGGDRSTPRSATARGAAGGDRSTPGSATARGQSGVTGAPQGALQPGEQWGRLEHPRESSSQGAAGGDRSTVGVLQTGGQTGVTGEPQGVLQPGGQPGATGAPLGVLQPGGQPGVTGAPQIEQQPGGQSLDDREQQLEEWCRLLEFDTPMATAEESEADKEPPMQPSPCPQGADHRAVGGVWEGRWRELFDSAMVAARPAVRPLAYTCSDQDPDAIRLSRCRSRCKVGEWSRGLACLTAGELARPSEAMVQSLREKHPASTSEVPQWVRDFTVDAPQRPPLTADILARTIHTAARASAAGPSGWVTEHLRDTFLTEPSCLSHLLEVFNQWVAGQVPERARPWLAASNLVGLSKPNGDVRPVAIGEVLPRILARALCISLRPAMASYFLPCNQLGAGTRAGAHKCRFWEREGGDVELALPLGMQRVEEGLTVVGVPIGEEGWEVTRFSTADVPGPDYAAASGGGGGLQGLGWLSGGLL